MLGGASMTWQIVYNHRGAVALKLVKGQASAVDAACDILDAGGEVYRIKIWTDRKDARAGQAEAV
jgi:hypothetical protein